MNESAYGWLYNYESFNVFRSWVTPEYTDWHRESFERLWKGERPGTLVLDLPVALEKKLIDHRSPEPPLADLEISVALLFRQPPDP